jgi:hypothetical protein
MKCQSLSVSAAGAGSPAVAATAAESSAPAASARGCITPAARCGCRAGRGRRRGARARARRCRARSGRRCRARRGGRRSAGRRRARRRRALTVLRRELAHRCGTLLEIRGEGWIHGRREVVDRVVQRRHCTRRRAAVSGVDRGSELVELVAERARLVAREQAGAPATAGDEECRGDAKPAGKECAGCGAHPRFDFRHCQRLQQVRWGRRACRMPPYAQGFIGQTTGARPANPAGEPPESPPRPRRCRTPSDDTRRPSRRGRARARRRADHRRAAARRCPG